MSTHDRFRVCLLGLALGGVLFLVLSAGSERERRRSSRAQPAFASIAEAGEVVDAHASAGRDTASLAAARASIDSADDEGDTLRVAIHPVDAATERPIVTVQRVYLLNDAGETKLAERARSGSLRIRIPASGTTRLRVEAGSYEPKELALTADALRDAAPLFVPMKRYADATGRVELTVRTADGTHVPFAFVEHEVVGNRRSGNGPAWKESSLRFVRSLPADRYRFRAIAAPEILADGAEAPSIFRPGAVEVDVPGGGVARAEIVLRRGGRIRILLPGDSADAYIVLVRPDPLDAQATSDPLDGDDSYQSFQGTGGQTCFVITDPGRVLVDVSVFNSTESDERRTDVRVGETTELDFRTE